ncbi:ribosomal protein L23/L15e core domain-containing protein [Sporodiniella umbellata]|nr:ribosomal protein L23/L15e core domain-containing protein [Sporodiniella umbellata]
MASQFRQGLNKVYLPNIIFKMVRSTNLQPNQVAFRVPPSCNKFDIHSYLTNIYGANVQEVRTMNYAATYKKGARGLKKISQPAYKKAIITLDETFTWPKEPEWTDLDRQEHELGFKTAMRKMRGWRLRPAEAEREKIKKVTSEKMAQMEAKSKK